MSVFAIGVMIVVATPVNEYSTSIEGKSQAMEHPTDDSASSSNPAATSKIR